MTLNKAIDFTLLSWRGLKSERQQTKSAQVILKELGNVELDAIDLRELRRTVWKDLSPATQKKRVNVLNKIMNEGKANGWQGSMPVKPSIRLDNSNPVFLSRDNIKALKEASRGDYMHDVIVFLLETSCRPSEMLNLEFRDLGRNNHGTETVTFRATKNGKNRTIPATRNVIAIIKRHIPSARVPSARVFDKFALRTIQLKWQKLAESVGLSGTGDFSLYVLRHTGASLMVQNGVAIAAVSAYLGHSNIQMTMRYAKFNTESLSVCSDIFDDF